MTSQRTNKAIKAICNDLAWLGLDKPQKIAVLIALERAFAAGVESARSNDDQATARKGAA